MKANWWKKEGDDFFSILRSISSPEISLPTADSDFQAGFSFRLECLNNFENILDRFLDPRRNDKRKKKTMSSSHFLPTLRKSIELSFRKVGS